MEFSFPQKEQEILDFWKKEKIFEKSVENRKKPRGIIREARPPKKTGRPVLR